MGKVYRVLKWALFETAKSRTYKQKSQGSFPIKMSGSGYLRMMREADGPAMYGCFIGICMVAHAASSLERRGYLTDTGGISGEPYDTDDISLKIGMAEGLVVKTIEFCMLPKMGWMAVETSLCAVGGCETTDTTRIPQGTIVAQDKTIQSKDNTEERQDKTTPPYSPPEGGSGGGGVDSSIESERPIRVAVNQNGIVGTLIAHEDPNFRIFWEAYPKKTRKLEAAHAWNAATKGGAQPAEIIAGVATCPGVVNASSSRKVLNPVAYLQGARWSDEPTGELVGATSPAAAAALADRLGWRK